MKRILQVNIDNNGGNGAYSLVNYYYENLKDLYIFDFFTMDKFVDTIDYRNIIFNGGKCFSANLRKNRLLGHLKLPLYFKKVIDDEKYEIVHIHSEVAYKVLLYAFVAKLSGVDKIIVHSHSSNIDGDYIFFKRILHKICIYLIPLFANIFIACSDEAARWMFINRIIQKKKYLILKNGILPNKFLYSEKRRKFWREKLKISENEILIGHVGSLKPVKNQTFILDIMNELCLKRQNFKLLFVGDGTDMQMLKKKSKTLGIDSKVIFLGNSDRVYELYSAMDLLLFPSLFEGVPMTLIEAQASGLKILASDVITSDIKITNLICFEKLGSDTEQWIADINRIIKENKEREDYNKIIVTSDFNITLSAKKLINIYG